MAKLNNNKSTQKATNKENEAEGAKFPKEKQRRHYEYYTNEGNHQENNIEYLLPPGESQQDGSM